MQAGKPYAELSRDEWIDLMNVLGVRLRDALAKRDA
jgi:hypothetical protein